jgi:hypothetical protein
MMDIKASLVIHDFIATVNACGPCATRQGSHENVSAAPVRHRPVFTGALPRRWRAGGESHTQQGLFPILRPIFAANLRRTCIPSGHLHGDVECR